LSEGESGISKLAGLLGIKRERRDLMQEMVELIEEGSAEGVLNSDEGEMLRSVLDFKRTLVREIMVPRTEMSAVEVESSLEELIERFVDDAHSRIPVFKGTVDHVIGIVHARDLLQYWARVHDEPSIRDLMRPAYFVPETMSIETLLAELKRRKTHIAIAVDEYGGVSGLITLEDVLEEIVGDIQDEYDEDDEVFIRSVSGGFEVDGRCDIETLEEELGQSIEVQGDFETVGGLVFSVMGRIPRPGESFVQGDLEFTIRAADERRVRSVFITGVEPKEEPPTDGAD